MSLTTMYPAKNNSPSTVLTADLSSSGTTMSVDDPSVLPSAPNIAVLGNSDTAEIVLYTAISGNDLTIVRGQNGTTPGTWGTGTAVARNFTALDHESFRENILDLESRKLDSVSWGDITGTMSDQTDLATAFGNKQDTLTFDSAPIEGSNNPVKSGGLYTALGLKAPLASPALTGAPTAPTAAVGTNNTQIATTAFVTSHDSFKITGTVSASNYTLTDSRINNEHWEVEQIYFATPSNVTSKIDWTTDITNHQVSLSATYAGSTNVIVKMHWVQ